MLTSALEKSFAEVIAADPPVSIDLPPLTYSALPSSTSIRLLNVYPLKGPFLRCSLHVVDLENVPRYDALSYTWGDSRVPILQSITPEQYRRRHNIICNDSLVTVTENLYLALQRIQSIKTNGFKIDGNTILQDFIWVDALCINQSDISERSSQVAIMDQVYTHCQMAVTWLGRENQYTDRAVNRVHQMTANQPGVGGALLRAFTNALNINVQSSSLPGSNTFRMISEMTEADWEPLVVLFSLTYFRRAWVIQELALAPKAVFLWGDRVMQWDQLLECDTIMRRHAVGNRYAYMRTFFSGIRDHLDQTNLIPLNGALQSVSGIRDPKQLYLGQKLPWYALGIINIGRSYLSTDPRDRVYAILGTVRSVIRNCPATEPTQLSIDDIPVPDYNKSTNQVYLEFAVWQIQISGTLYPLMLTGDRGAQKSELTELSALPSWVPDFSVTIVPMPMLLVGSKYWKADGHEEHSVALPLDDGILVARAAFFDRIEKVSATLGGLMSKETLSSVLKLVESLAGYKYPLLPTTYMDALWRTLIMDTELSTSGKTIHPADPSRRQDFNEWLVSRTAFFEGSPTDNRQANSRRCYEIQRILLKELVYQASQDPAIFTYSGRTDEEYALNAGFEEHNKAAFSLRRAPQSSWAESRDEFLRYCINVASKDGPNGAYDAMHIQNALRTLLQVTDLDGKKEAMLARIGRFRSAVENAIVGRRLFVTATGCIGLGGQSLRVGDQSWIFAGMGCPAILRPTAGGRYEWVGEAYIHGIMHGEAVKSGNLQFHDIDLQ